MFHPVSAADYDGSCNQLMCGNLPRVSESGLRIPRLQHDHRVSRSPATQNRTKLSGMKLSPQKLNVRKSFQQDPLESAPKGKGESPINPQRNVKLD